MKKLVFLFLSLLAAGSIFQACDDSKTYAEMLEDEKNAVNRFISDNGIRIISQEEFERNDTVTSLDRNEYVSLSDGVYMQIVSRGVEDKTDTFATNNEICVRYVEQDIMTRDTTCWNVFLKGWEDYNIFYDQPSVFRYVAQGSYVYGTFLQIDFAWGEAYQGLTAVPAGWLLALPFVRNGAHVRLIVPSKVGHDVGQRDVKPYFYDIRKFSKALN